MNDEKYTIIIIFLIFVDIYVYIVIVDDAIKITWIVLDLFTGARKQLCKGHIELEFFFLTIPW